MFDNVKAADQSGLMRRVALIVFGLTALGAATTAEAAPVSYACPEVFGTNLLIIDIEARKAQIVGDALALRSSNYAVPMTVFAAGTGNVLITLTPPFGTGGGAMIPGDEATGLRYETGSGNLVALEYAKETVLGQCSPTNEPAAFVEVTIPALSTAPTLTCVPFDTSAPTLEEWTPVAADAFTIAFDGGAAHVQHPDSGFDAITTERVEKIFLTAGPNPGPAVWALSRYSGNLFLSENADLFPGRLSAHCTAG